MKCVMAYDEKKRLANHKLGKDPGSVVEADVVVIVGKRKNGVGQIK